MGNIRKFLFILIIFSLTGCTTVSRNQKLEQQVAELQKVISEKDNELKLKEDQLREKDLNIEQLRKKLESFGVF